LGLPSVDKVSLCDVEVVEPDVAHSGGFWKSCKPDTRARLIESKAEMHIAENKRRAMEENAKLERMNSPEAILANVLRVVKNSEEWAKRSSDSKVAGWAKTVATDFAETVARSAPSTVRSFDSVTLKSEIEGEIVEPVKLVEKKAPVDVVSVENGTELNRCDTVLQLLKTIRIDNHKRFPIVAAVNARKMKLELDRIPTV